MLYVGIHDSFVTHGSVGQLRKAFGLDADSIKEKIRRSLGIPDMSGSEG